MSVPDMVNDTVIVIVTVMVAVTVTVTVTGNNVH